MNFCILFFCLALLSVIWSFANMIANVVVSRILKWIRRRKKLSGKKINRCPMLECNDVGCFGYDKEHLQCRYAAVGLTLDPEVTDDVN